MVGFRRLSGRSSVAGWIGLQLVLWLDMKSEALVQVIADLAG